MIRRWPAAILSLACFACADASTISEQIQLPDGFQIEIYSDDIPGARSLTLGSRGTLFVGTRGDGSVYAVRDKNADYVVDSVFVVASGLNSPNGVAYRDGNLYVAEIDRILRYDEIESRLSNPPEPVIVSDDFPSDGHHGWKFIAFGPDGYLYVPVGAPCNVCLKDDSIYASITRMKPDGTDHRVFARGIRNTVGFAWHPVTNELWFTDNGRDLMGDNVPPDELNCAPNAGMHFGFPFCHGGDIPDPHFGDERPCSDFVQPRQNLGPHVAALGMRFYTGTMFPAEFRNQIFIAEHGSWNRSTRIGYRITLARLDGNRVTSYRPFAEGWLNDSKVSGRPVDLLVLPDGSMLVSDDYAGAIYRITFSR